MDKFDRIQQLHRIFSERRYPVTVRELAEKLECSERTIKRSFDTLRDHLQAPLEYVEDVKGWCYSTSTKDQFELPGIWFTTDEIRSLATMLHLIQSMDASLLDEGLKPIEIAIDQLLRSRRVEPEAFRYKVRYLPKTHRATPGKSFSAIGTAVFAGKRLQIRYKDYSGKITEREISPLKLIHYHENWYVDAWCHFRSGLRSFMIARIAEVKPLDQCCKIVDEAEQKEHFGSSYGIFGGIANQVATLEFYGAAASEAASYEWHPEQIGQWKGNSYVLSIPYSDDRELVRTILGFGPEVNVLEPAELRNKVKDIANQILCQYSVNMTTLE